MAMDCKEFHPYPYQQFCIQHIIDHPAAGLFVDMGILRRSATQAEAHHLGGRQAGRQQHRQRELLHGHFLPLRLGE